MASLGLRCDATDPEGYRCVLIPSHEGRHQWFRCEATDTEGYRCILPPSHPGDHELAWFAKPTTPGATRTARYRGKYERVAAQAEGEAQVLASHHWFPISQTYIPGSWGTGAWVLAFLTLVFLIGIIILAYMIAAKPAGELVVVYEYRPPTSTS